MADTINNQTKAHEPASEKDAGSAADYFELLKPRVMSLVVFTALIGMVVAPGDLHPVMAFAGLVFIAIGAGASAALNMWYDADIDAQMTRTAERPVPSGRIDKETVLSFGLWLSGISVFCLGVFVNWTAAALLAFTIFFYAVIYTMWLKRSTPQNIVIGGAAGAFPPMIGWAVATGEISLYPIVLFAIIFFWTPPHFWALALLKNDEYKSVGVPMLPVTAGERVTRNQIMIYALVMSGTAMLPYVLGYAGLFYGLTALFLNAIFICLAVWLFVRKPETITRPAQFLFAYSIFYLFLLFAALPADLLIG
ncbi:MAG: heme o synthase [Parvibaculales bacterium]